MPLRRKSPSSAPSACAAQSKEGRAILSEQQWQAIAEALKLSNRELQIVHCIFDDRTEAGIARQLGISSHTVHTHLERLYRKLGVACRCGAAVRVFAEHLALEEGGREVYIGRLGNSQLRSSQLEAQSDHAPRPSS